MTWQLHNLLSPFVIPCYIFLVTVPYRLRTIRTTGMPGRQQAQQYYKYEEMAKKFMILMLIAYSVSNLFAANATEVDTEPNQIDSTVERVNHDLEGPNKYTSFVQSVTFIFAFVLSAM